LLAAMVKKYCNSETLENKVEQIFSNIREFGDYGHKLNKSRKASFRRTILIKDTCVCLLLLMLWAHDWWFGGVI
jgi:hypothetical protein